MRTGHGGRMTDLHRRICITLAVLALYRLGVHIPIPGVDADLYLTRFGEGSHLFLRGFPGASSLALQSVSIFTLGIAPYLTAALLVRLASLAFTGLRDLEDGTPSQQRRVVMGTRLLALALVVPQAYGLAMGLEWFGDFAGEFIPAPGLAYRWSVVVTLVASTAAIMWLADQITLHGLGNGIALILFADIVWDLPRTLAGFVELTRTGAIPFEILAGLGLLTIALVALVVNVGRAALHAGLRFPEQQDGARTLAVRPASIPLPVIAGGLVSAVLAIWLMSTAFYLVTSIAFGDDGYAIDGWVAWMWYGHPAHIAVSAVLIVAMAYFYSLAVIRPKRAAAFLESKGARIFRARPGQETENALRQVLFRLALIGGGVLALIYLLPEILLGFLPQLPGSIGGAGLLIAVAVALDTLHEGAHRLHRQNGGGPPGEHLSIAMGPEYRSRISAGGR